mmetsp:Transcript_6400/g.8400  ORF Transcript_6400/g.8400 Transcript_6400/m.8400 type:complete len:368 (-) Transcript_6400:239-1342(-)
MSEIYADLLSRTEVNLSADTKENGKYSQEEAIKNCNILRARTLYGVLRCDYEYTPTRGDIGCPESFTEGPLPMVMKVEGWTFEAAQRGPDPSTKRYPAAEFRLTNANGEEDAYWTKLWKAVEEEEGRSRSGYRQVTKKEETGNKYTDGYFEPEDYIKGVVMRYDPEVIEENMRQAVKALTQAKVCGITADVGYSMQFQESVVQMTNVPVMLSSLQQLSLISKLYKLDSETPKKIIVLTANSSTFDMDTMIPSDLPTSFVSVVGMQNNQFGKWVAGGNSFSRFEDETSDDPASVEVALEAVYNATKAEVERIQNEGATVCAIVMECTELPAYTNALRLRLGIPVYDTMTAVSFLQQASGFAPHSAFIM